MWVAHLWLELRSLWSLYCTPFNLGFVNTNCKPWLQGYGSAECKDLAGMHALVVRISCGRCWCRSCWADEFTVNWLVRPKCLYPAIIGIQLRMIPCIWLWRHLTSPQWFYKYLLMAGVWFWKNCLDWYPLETCPEVSKVIHRGFGIAVWSWSSLQVRPTDRKKIAIR